MPLSHTGFQRRHQVIEYSLQNEDSFYFITLHPKAENGTFFILSPIKTSGWNGALLVLFALVLIKIMCVTSEDNMTVLVYYTLGALGASKSVSPVKLEFSTGKMVHLLWALFIFFMIVFYNVEIHSKIISQQFEWVPKSPHDLEFPSSIIYPLNSPIYVDSKYRHVNYVTRSFTVMLHSEIFKKVPSYTV